jgi:hypothetical protein
MHSLSSRHVWFCCTMPVQAFTFHATLHCVHAPLHCPCNLALRPCNLALNLALRPCNLALRPCNLASDINSSTLHRCTIRLRCRCTDRQLINLSPLHNPPALQVHLTVNSDDPLLFGFVYVWLTLYRRCFVTGFVGVESFNSEFGRAV